MATSLQNLVCDSSTLTNFKAWAQAIGTFIGTTAGWLQSGDTGQVNWSTISSVPGSGAYVYEIWEPNDALSNFYLKIEYGNLSGGSNCPTVRLTIAQSTNGAGTLSSPLIGPYTTNQSTFTAPSTTATYECRLSGAPGRLSILLWRLGGNNCAQAFAAERSVNSSGTYVGTYVTLFTSGNAGGQNHMQVNQQTLHFTLGAAPAQSVAQTSNPIGGLAVRAFNSNSGLSGAFNSSVPFDTMAPFIGYFDYPSTCVGISATSAVPEGTVFTTTLYGSTRTYIGTYSGYLGLNAYIGSSNVTNTLCMRYD